MVKFRDLTKTLSLRSIQLSALENQLLLQRAASEMAERSMPGVFVVPLCFALAVITSGYVYHSPYSSLVLAVFMLGGAAGRCLAIVRIKQHSADLLSLWIQMFFWSCLVMAVVWGVTTAIFVYTYIEGFPVLLILVLSSGIGAGSMVNFCIWRALTVNILLWSFVPVILIGLFMQQAALLPAILGIGFFVLYLLAQTKRWNFHFWDSLITAYLFERQAEKLSDTNRSLAETIAKEQESRREVERGRVKIRELFNLTGDGIVICALDGRILDVNLAMLDMFAVRREEILSTMKLQSFMPQADGKLSLRDHWQRAVDGLEDDFECSMAWSKGRKSVLVHVNLRRVSWQEEQIVFVTLRDVTVRKQMEHALKITRKSLSESEGYLHAILRNVELPIYCKDLNGCYLTVNKPFEQLCCRTLAEMQGKNDLQIFPENLGRFLSFRDPEIVVAGESFELEGTFTIGSQEKNLLVHKFPLRESGGSIYATAGICTDVTTMKQALQTAQLANEAKSEFLASMSHELRTPMHSILSVARLGLKRVNTATREKLESYFTLIVTSGDQLLELLSDLLDLSTLESAKACYSFREYDLVKDLEKMVAEFKAMMDEKQISLCLEADASSAPARYDKTKFYQVVRNLLANAMKFTPPHEEVRIVLKKDYLESNGYRQVAWKIMVIDQGIGLEENDLESVFGKFVKGHKTLKGAGGVGLGLSICKRIVEDHRGVIWAERNAEKGATFCFMLPALDQKPRANV